MIHHIDMKEMHDDNMGRANPLSTGVLFERLIDPTANLGGLCHL